MAPILPSLELRPLFSRRLMRSTSMRGGSIDERSIRERERESEENDSRNLVSVFTVASAPQFSRSSWKEGKVEAKPPRRNSICRDRKQLSTSVLFRSSLFLSFYSILSFSPAISIAITKSIYHDAHTARQKLLLNRTFPRSLVSELFSIPLECDVTILL